MKKAIAISVLLGSVALVAGCAKKTPAGQVAAVVNGEEVTLGELNTELAAANVPPSADKQTVQRAILQRVVERKLLVAAAHDNGLDQTPEFLAQKRRADELMLVQAYARKQLTAVPVPSQAEVDKFMADNAGAFSGREQWVLDQIRFATPPNTKSLSALQQAHSMADVQATLTKLGIQYERGDVGLDTAALPADVLKKINALSPTEPIVIPQPGVITVSVIKARKPVPVDMAKARPAAVQAWRQRRFAETLTKQVDQLKAGAKITYQNGYGPPAADKNVMSGAPMNGSAPKAP
jgi:peptidyl-prolyl cis-trans isomerase C